MFKCGPAYIVEASWAITLVACSGSSTSDQVGTGGGTFAAGGTSAIVATATGGRTTLTTGDNQSAAGTANTATGAISSTGGATNSTLEENNGGTPAFGGSRFTGGASTTGGSASTGAANATGGRPTTGGAVSTGGAQASGGIVSTGGSKSTLAAGGAPNIGGTTGASGRSVKGPIPALLPAHMLIGNFAADDNETWMSQSGVKWDVRWVYLSGQHGNDWYNVWGYGAADGAWMSDWLTQCDQQGFIPGIHLYNIGYGHDQGDSGLLTEVRTASFVANYFTEFKALMQKAKAFGKPIIIVLEGDSFGMIEGLTNNDPTASATIASSGLADLQGLPNTVAGLGLAYLQIRKSVAAYNVAMGPDVPAYEANGDIMHGDNSTLQPHVDFQSKFFLPFGLGENVTGDRFDFAASNPLSADADYYRLVNGDSSRWWDASDSAPVNSLSFNRYAEWLRLFNQATGVRWVLHQLPIGNSNNLNTASDCDNPTDACTPRTGYKDNRPEYFLNYDAPSSKTIRDAHLAKFADAGVFALLFGGTEGGSTTSYNDTWTDGKLFLKSRVEQLVADTNGGFPIQ